MDPSAAPTAPPACGTWDLQAAASADCGSAMSALCGNKSLYNGAAIADLLNPVSNCGHWRNAIQLETVIVGAAPPGAAALDATMHAYCAAEPTAPECACIAFPYIPAAAPFCNSADCPAPPGSCSSDVIAQSRGDGTVSVLEFMNGCTPHFCWLESCFDPNGLIPSSYLQQQATPGACPGWCALVEGRNTFSGGNPMPPGSWNVQGGGLITQCGVTAVGPTPFLAESQFLWSANSSMQQPLAVSNMGDLPVVLSLSGVSVPWATVVPQSDFLIPGRSMQLMLLVASQSILQAAQAAAPNGVFNTAVALTFSYPDAQGATTLYTSTQSLQVGPPQPPLVYYRQVVPQYFYVALAIFGLLALLMLLRAHRARAFVRRFLRHPQI